jgi:signal transduction histidine kinase
MKFISIRKKFFSFAMQILIGTLGVSQLTASILLIVLSHKTFRDGEERIEENLIDKGRVLVANNSIALQGMTEDNAFVSINELVSSTIEKDKDVVYGIYMDNLRQPWVRITPEYPRGRFEALTVANDSMSIWADSLLDVAFKKLTKKNSSIIEFASPVFVMGQKMGTIRYGISTYRMEQSVLKLKNEFYQEIIKYTIILIIISSLLLFFELKAATNQADSITKPLDELTQAANMISKGNYNAPVQTSTNDEIGVLSYGFETMRRMVKRYTDNLEQMVEERTQKLNSSLKEQLIQANKLVTLGTLVAGVAHEVNNPNNSILLSSGALEEIWRDIEPILNEYVDQNGEFKVGGYTYTELVEEMPLLISRIINNSRRIKSIVEDLKNYARKDHGDVKQDLDINLVIRDSISIIDNEIKKHTKKFLVTLKDNLPTVKGVHRRLEQVIVNLIQNACQALESPDKGVFVSTNFDPSTNSIIVSIRDEGVGMDQETMDNILQSFYTTKHNKGGTGLGLVVTSRIVKDHNGELQFKSEPGKGTLAQIILPVVS